MKWDNLCHSNTLDDTTMREFFCVMWDHCWEQRANIMAQQSSFKCLCKTVITMHAGSDVRRKSVHGFGSQCGTCFMLAESSCLLYMGHLEHLRITTMKGISKLVTWVHTNGKKGSTNYIEVMGEEFNRNRENLYMYWVVLFCPMWDSPAAIPHCYTPPLSVTIW